MGVLFCVLGEMKTFFCGGRGCVTPVVLTDAGALNPVFRKTASCETKSAGDCI